MGMIWMVLAPVVIYFLVMGAVHNISSTGVKDINKPVPWIIIISIFTPYRDRFDDLRVVFF
jgi:hypothetical protein